MTATAFLQDVGRAGGSNWSGLPAGAAAWALAEVAREARAGRGSRALPLLAVLPSRDDAARFAAEARFYLDRHSIPVALFPADDVRTWDGLSPHPDIPRQRLVALDLLDRNVPSVVVAPARALQHRALPPSVLRELVLELAEGEVVGRDALVAALVDRGYLATQEAAEPGTVSWRGGVVDLWPTGDDGPVRIEFFDDEVESVRRLDPRTRRGVGPAGRLRVLPAREAVVSERSLARAGEVMAAAVDAMGGGQATRRRIIEELKEGLWFPGAEDFLAALHPVVDPLSYARGTVVVVDPARVSEELDRFDALARSRWEAIEVALRPPILPEVRFASASAVRRDLASALLISDLALDGALDFGARDNEPLRVGRGELAPSAGRIAGWLAGDWQVALACDTRARAERVLALLHPHGLDPTPLEPAVLPPPGAFGLWVGALDRGFHCPTSRLAVVAADELFVARERAAPPPRALRDAVLSSVAELKAGDLVVHVRHGIGRFEGLKRIATPVREASPLRGRPAEVIAQDFAVVVYRDDDRMYLPVSRLDQLYRYRVAGGEAAEPRLDRLGGATWAARKSRVRDKVLGMAHELLQLHAARAVVEGHAYEGTPDALRRFEEAFPYVETPDQEAAIADVLADLANPEPMDRLIVGDVGFGKTEVAMRAAMRVVLEGRQVAVLCPTTVLAFQHARTFRERFAGFGVEIDLLSTFRSPAEVRETLAGVRDGRVRILIGTHSLLGRSVRFKDLGLVVVDEEHRFGVKQKQRLLRLAQAWSALPCEHLALSATPIPRTLHMALSGLRPVSLIATPPAGRRSIQTHVLRWSEERIREEILHELRRGGQVYFVHNRVESIGVLAERLRALVPEATFGVAHGQMADHELERVLVDFIQRRFHVLVCTTIIESGVDLPNVNTMIVNRADRLGLAQLYQLRGRVGRSHVRGYCTLLVPESGDVPRAAADRLRVLQENVELGAGFAIASADLELRGAGDLLGESQHGHIEAVGFETYVELLEEAIAVARGEHARQRLDPEIEVPVPALLPETWIEDVTERLAEYRRLAACRSPQQVRDLVAAWEDAYGEPPPEVLNLGWQAEAKVHCRALGIERVTWLKVRVVIEIHESSPVPADRIRDLVTREAARFQLAENKLVVRFTPDEAEWPYRFLHWVFRRLEDG